MSAFMLAEEQQTNKNVTPGAENVRIIHSHSLVLLDFRYNGAVVVRNGSR